MDLMKFISGGYILFFLLFLFVGLFFKIKVGYAYRVGVIILAITAAVFAYRFEPGVRLDLYRLQRYIQSLNFDGANFWGSIWGAEGVLSGTSITGMISFNVLCYLISLTGDPHWLSTISVFLTIGVLLSVHVDYIIEKKYSSREFGIGVILIFLGMPLQNIYSGIRNNLAVTAVVLGLYLLFFKKRSIVFSIILLFAGATMHPAVLILIIPLLFCRIKHQKLVRVVCLLSVPFIFILPNILKLIPLSFFQYLGNRIAFYKSTQYQYDRPEMIANIIIFLAVGFLLWINRNLKIIDIQDGLELSYINAYYILGFIMLGCSIHRDFALRIGYIMGIMAVPIASKLYYIGESDSNKMNFSTFALTGIILVCAIKVYYDTILGFSHWNFS